MTSLPPLAYYMAIILTTIVNNNNYQALEANSDSEMAAKYRPNDLNEWESQLNDCASAINCFYCNFHLFQCEWHNNQCNYIPTDSDYGNDTHSNTPCVIQFTPKSGPIEGGTIVTTGKIVLPESLQTNFKLYFNHQPINYTSNNQIISFITPKANQTSSAHITISKSSKNFAFTRKAFRYIQVTLNVSQPDYLFPNFVGRLKFAGSNLLAGSKRSSDLFTKVQGIKINMTELQWTNKYISFNLSLIGLDIVPESDRLTFNWNVDHKSDNVSIRIRPEPVFRLPSLTRLLIYDEIKNITVAVNHIESLYQPRVQIDHPEYFNRAPDHWNCKTLSIQSSLNCQVHLANFTNVRIPLCWEVNLTIISHGSPLDYFTDGPRVIRVIRERFKYQTFYDFNRSVIFKLSKEFDFVQPKDLGCELKDDIGFILECGKCRLSNTAQPLAYECLFSNQLELEHSYAVTLIWLDQRFQGDTLFIDLPKDDRYWKAITIGLMINCTLIVMIITSLIYFRRIILDKRKARGPPMKKKWDLKDVYKP